MLWHFDFRDSLFLVLAILQWTHYLSVENKKQIMQIAGMYHIFLE